MSSAELAGLMSTTHLVNAVAGHDEYLLFPSGDAHPVAGTVESRLRVQVSKVTSTRHLSKPKSFTDCALHLFGMAQQDHWGDLSLQ
jgi:hypothetical protein